MKTLTINIYKFSELSEEAKQKAIQNYRENGVNTDFVYDDAYETVKKFNNIFNIKECGRSWLDFSVSHIDDNVLNLSGLRLRTYIINNFGRDLFKPKYIGSLSTNDYVSHKRIKSPKNVNSVGNRFNPYYSGCQTETSCVLTGVCYDDDLLRPVYEFLKWNLRPDYNSYMTFESLISDCFESLQKCIDDEIDYRNSDESIIEEIEANDYQFTEEGEIY